MVRKFVTIVRTTVTTDPEHERDYSGDDINNFIVDGIDLMQPDESPAKIEWQFETIEVIEFYIPKKEAN